MVSPTPGLIAQMTGRLTTARYNYATVYVDQASRLGYVYIQKTSAAEETIEGKKAFERYAADRGIQVRAYHADNGVFRAKAWVAACAKANQRMTYAGVNAHHENGIAEKRIRDLQDLARTMLLHASRRWPKAINAHLWPYALRMANDAINEAPSLRDSQRRTPNNIFANTEVQSNPKHWKPFGCPAYVLDSQLQAGKPSPKWSSRAHVGIYLGRSPQHSRNVALILDRTTGLVSPQYHVTFDSSFHTARQDQHDTTWQEKAGFVERNDPEPDGKQQRNEPQTLPTTKQPEGAAQRGQKRTGDATTSLAAAESQTKRIRADGTGGPKHSEPKQTAAEGIINNNRSRKGQIPEDDGTKQLQQPESPTGFDQSASQGKEEAKTGKQTDLGSGGNLRKSGRTSRPVQRLIEAMVAEITTQQSSSSTKQVPGEILCYSSLYPRDDEATNMNPLLAYKATADPDTMYLHQAMKAEDRKDFQTAMMKEVQAHLDNGNFKVIHQSEVPEGEAILPTVWQMKRKRDIRTREIKKHKARLNVDGSKMIEGIHYTETYAPVASWNSIRMLLILSQVHGWKTRQIDYVQAYPQVPAEKPLYLKIPKGIEVQNGKNKDYVLKREQNVYGQKRPEECGTNTL